MSETLQQFPEVGVAPKRVAKIQGWIEGATKLHDQVRRRLLEHEKIPLDEKLFSVYERHTCWIIRVKSKGRSWVYRSR